MSKKIAILLSRDRNPGPRQTVMERALLDGLESRVATPVLVVPHLYDLAPEGPTVQAIRAIEGDLIVLAWLYPRSVYWVLEANQIAGKLGQTSSLGEIDSADEKAGRAAEPDSPHRTIWCFDLRLSNEPGYFLRQVDDILARALPSGLEGTAGESKGKVRVMEESTRPRWYPVVDRHRCTGCMECLNFCLFGVYGLDLNGKILVEEPDACRPGCPACARICPAAAIIFPQHSDPAIAGDPLLSLEGLKLDLSQIFAGIDPVTLAAQERKKALASHPPLLGDGDTDRIDHETAKSSLDKLVDQVDGLQI